MGFFFFFFLQIVFPDLYRHFDSRNATRKVMVRLTVDLPTGISPRKARTPASLVVSITQLWHPTGYNWQVQCYFREGRFGCLFFEYKSCKIKSNVR